MLLLSKSIRNKVTGKKSILFPQKKNKKKNQKLSNYFPIIFDKLIIDDAINPIVQDHFPLENLNRKYLHSFRTVFVK